MRWGLRRRDKADEWAKRLGVTGLQLDRLGMPLRDVAVSVTGETTRVDALGLYAGRHHHGWKPLRSHLDGSESITGIDFGVWCARLRTLGVYLDRDPRLVRNPCVVQLAETYLVVAVVAELIDGVTRWESASWRWPLEHAR